MTPKFGGRDIAKARNADMPNPLESGSSEIRRTVIRLAPYQKFQRCCSRRLEKTLLFKHKVQFFDMARSTKKNPTKQSPTSASAPAPAAIPPPQKRKGPPIPFELPPSNLSSQFLSTLPNDHIYIIHVDTTPRTLKRQVFLVPVCMNIALSVLLVWRLYYAIPMYFDLIIGTLGYYSRTAVDVQASSRTELFNITITRTLTLMGDYMLFSLLGSWPWRFVFGVAATRYSSPLKWRMGLGFQDREVTVRQSRIWDKSLLPDWTIDDELTLKHKIMPALERKYLEKTGYLLEDKNWSLDFQAIADAHSLIDAKKLEFKDFEKAVLVFYPPSNGPHGGWMIWRVSNEDQPKTAEQRDALVRFKDKLTLMGHEDLFYRWVELVQYESNSPGGFTQGRQAVAMREAKRMFEEKGIDFASFW